MVPKEDTLPETAVPWSVAAAGVGGFATGFALAWFLRAVPAAAMLALIGCTGAPMWWLEWRRHRDKAESRSAALPGEEQRLRRTWRMQGLMTAVLLWLVTLCVLPLANRAVVAGFWNALGMLWPLALLAAAHYVLRPAPGPLCGLELPGRWWTHRTPGEHFPWHVLRDQLVKAFFLPLMVGFAWNWAMQADWSKEPILVWYFSTLALLYLADTVFGTVGYLSTARALDAHIRSSNPYPLGWAAALVCYPPLFTWLQQAGFDYHDGQLWMDWLGPSQPLLYAWGGAVLLLTAIYALSTVVFGIRFSNLTNRGILTHGPYRFTKHPAYISKNLSWWLISVPFVSNAGAGTAALHCAILLCMNGIYWLRARTEERHLMQDPTYRAYAAWIAEHGLFARLGRMLPSTGARERRYGH